MPLAEYYQARVAPSSLAALTRNVLGSADTWVRLQAVIHPVSHRVPVTAPGPPIPSSVPDFRMHGFRLRSRVVYKLIGGYGTFYPRLLGRTTVLKLLKSRSDVRPIGPPGGALGVLQGKSNTAPGQCGCDLAIAEAGHLPSFLPSISLRRLCVR